jgi:hypothetical protein
MIGALSNKVRSMKKIFYEKVGRRYVPVAEYDNELLDSFPKGNHLVMSYPGGMTRVFNIDPNYAAMIAAGRVAEDKISEAIRQASDLRPKRAPITPAQQAAWENLIKEFGEEARCLEWPSAREVAEEAVRAMQAEADRLMKHASVREAFEHFQLLCKLVEDKSNA